MKKKILIIDDERFYLTLLVDLLKDDYNPVVAKSGKRALELLQSTDLPDLILLDIIMPDMDGYAVLEEIQKNQKISNIPVVFLTVKNEPDSEAKGLELGAIDYLHKPISPAVVKARVANHIELADTKKELERQNQALRKSAALREEIDEITKHDLKSPLFSIVYVPKLLLSECDFTPIQKKLVQGIERAGYKMLRMINLSMDLYKMERQAYSCNFTPVNLLTTLNNVCDELNDQISSKSLEIILKFDENSPKKSDQCIILGEELLCHSMFGNLIQNAVEASPENESIRINLLCKGKEIEVYIQNQGAVPEEIRDSFFEKYVTKGKPNGTGLGTYSAQLIAEVLEARIHPDTTQKDQTLIKLIFHAFKG